MPETEDHLFEFIFKSGVYGDYVGTLPHCVLVRDKRISQLLLQKTLNRYLFASKGKF